MLHQIQADIAVKEELVAQLERSELEYTCMRAQYEERLNMLQEHLLEVQKQRDLALRRAGFTIRPESSIHLKEKVGAPSSCSESLYIALAIGNAVPLALLIQFRLPPSAIP